MINLKEKIAEFPTSPGVYLMKGETGKIIYVGKAVNLRARVRNYFAKEADSRYQIKFLMNRVKDIDTLVTDNEKEALLLENSLIKKHKPRYNIFLKDDKTYVSLKLTANHPFPSLIVTRKIKKDGALYFGPYSSAQACRETVDFIYRHFRLRTCSDHEINNRSRPCLEYQIHRCTAPCVGYVSQEDYGRQVDQVRLFLEGKSEALITQAEESMKRASDEERFEEAARLRDLLANIKTTLEKQKVVRHGGLHQDLVSLYREGNRGVIALFVIRDGTLIDSRYYPALCLEEEAQVIEHFLNQYYLGSVFIPDEILVSHLPEDSALLAGLLTSIQEKKVVIRAPQKGEKKDLIELAEKNARSQFSRLVNKEYQTQEALKLLQEALGLSKFPHRMECYDISNISGKQATGSRVVFVDGEPDKKEYRHYKIRMDGEPNDYAMMREVLGRRFGHLTAVGAIHELPLPDLLVIDGGKGQLNTALRVLEESGFGQIAAIGVAKGKGAGARAKGLWKGKKEGKFLSPTAKIR
ncbi:MAG: excinuclease ABC subunit UvrC [Deltaproteobacteria bacterium]|nr:excinuclease ABC subunit UvrC [Deltaproteobacteria bacterium]